MCGLEWVVGEEVAKEGSSEEDMYVIEDAVVEEDIEKNQFASVISTFIWLQPNSLKNFPIGCRYVLNYVQDNMLHSQIRTP